jgi:cytochrome P450
MNHLADEYNLRQYGLFYLDLYPIQADPLLVVASPEVAAQVTQIKSYPKHPILRNILGPALGNRGIVGQEGAEWKELRTMFNPGFSQGNLFSMVPMMVSETEIFAARLSALAAGDGFVSSIEKLAADLTIDVIGQAVLGLRFNSQTSENSMVQNIIRVAKLVEPVSNISPQRLNIWKAVKIRYFGTMLNNELTKILRMRWSELAGLPEKAKNSNAIFDIAMAMYMKKGGKIGESMTQNFLELMRDK